MSIIFMLSAPHEWLKGENEDMSRAGTDAAQNIPCVILAGGQSRRFGSNKAFARLDEMYLIEVLVERLRRQTSGPIAVNATIDPILVELGYPIVNDRLPSGLGPLVGIHAALAWAGELGYETVITAPVDTPILPDDYIAKLSDTSLPAIAKYAGKAHFIHGAWPVAIASDLAQVVAEGTRAVRAWTEKIEARECVFPEQPGLSPFFNVNIPSDLQELEAAQTVSPR